MKIVFVLFFMGFISMSTSVFSQNQTLTLREQNASLHEIFKEIEKQSGCRFFYNDELVDVKKTVSIDVTNASIDEVLNIILGGTDLRYKRMENNLIVVSSSALLQQSIVSGNVTDASGALLPGVNIAIEGTSVGVVSDFEGKYSINVPNGEAVLAFSFVGFATQRITVGSRTVINVVLHELAQEMDEVVVIGYGTQKKVNLTGAVAAVKIDEKMASRSVTSLSSGLFGLLPGLNVQQSTGMAGYDGASLQIRGLGSVNNANPLIVVDGMPDVNINRINMSDVESVSVLKDAASSAIYGSRAANGVVLITTKTGKSNEKAKINYTGSYAISDISNFYPFFSDYPKSIAMEMRAAGAGNQATGFREGSMEQWMAMGMIDPFLFPNTNQFDVGFRQGSIQNHSISAQGGTEKFAFFLSTGVMKEKGIVVFNDYDRYNFRLNLDYKIRNNITVGSRMDGQWTKGAYGRYGLFESNVAIAGITIYDPETGHYGGAMAVGEDSMADNILAEYLVYKDLQNEQQYNGNVYGIWEIIKGLKARVDYSLHFFNKFTNNIQNGLQLWNFQTNQLVRTSNEGTRVSQTSYQGYKTLFQGQISYDRELFKGHRLSVLAVAAQEYWFERDLNASRRDLLHSSLSELNAALQTTVTTGGSSSSEGLLSYIGRLNYTMYDKYLLEVNFRYDGSSKFISDKQFGFFPSIAAGWRVSEERFFDPLKSVVNQAKIRISYGSLGNNAGVGRTEQQETLGTTNYNLNGTIVNGFSNFKLINSSLSWEATRVTNLGLDMGFFNNRLSAEFDLYDKLTTGMIRPSDLSMMLGGYSAPRINIGELRNRGLEINLNWQSQIGKVHYSINFNAAWNRNKLEKWNEYLSRGNVFIDMPYHFVYGYEAEANLVQSWNEIYNAPLQTTSTSWMAPGDLLLKDVNGDGQVTAEDYKASPNKYRDRSSGQYGLTLSAQWKGFDLWTLLQASTGRYNYWLDDFNTVNVRAGRMVFIPSHWTDTWTLDNRNASLPRMVTGSGGRNRDASSFWLYNTSYLRMRNLQLGYSLPKQWIQKIRIENFRIYLSAENLFTLTKWPGIDPEVTDTHPLIKTFSIGLNIGL